MAKTWNKSTGISATASAIANALDSNEIYMGSHVAISRDGTRAIASSEAGYAECPAYVFEKAGSNWSVVAELPPDYPVLWQDTFDGVTTFEKFTHETPTGTITEAGGKLTLTTADSVDSGWATCPIAWRTDNVSSIHRLRTTISAFSAASADFGAGPCAFYQYDEADDRTEGCWVELYYDAGTYKLQMRQVYGGVISTIGPAVSVEDPNVTPLELDLLLNAYSSVPIWYYRQGGSEWTLGHEDNGYEVENWFNLMRTGVYARNGGAFPAGSVSFDEFSSHHPQILGNVTDVAIEGDTAVVVCNWTATNPELFDTFQADDAAASDEYGTAIATSYVDDETTGQTLAMCFVGAPGENSEQGAVYVMALYEDYQWKQIAKLTASDGVAGDRFGAAVATPSQYTSSLEAAEILLVGAPNATIGGNANAGAVYRFERQSDGTWTQQEKWNAPTPAAGGLFGSAVSAEDYYDYVRDMFVAIGEPGAEQAHAWVRTRSTLIWSAYATVTPSDGAGGDSFGSAVCMDRDRRLSVGSPNHNAGAGAVYSYAATGLGTETKLVASDAAAGDGFGTAIHVRRWAYDGFIVGAPGRSSSKGAVYIFSAGVQQNIIAPDYLVAGDHFGIAVVSDGARYLVGADGNGTHAGFCVLLINTWSYKDGYTDLGKFVPDTNGATDSFGRAVGILCHYLYGGAPGKSTDTGAVSGWHYDYLLLGQDYYGAAARIYKKSGGVWSLDQIIREMVTYRAGSFVSAALSEDEETLAIGCSNQPYNCASVEVFDGSSGSFVHQKTLALGPTYADSNNYYSNVSGTSATAILSSDGNKLVAFSPYLNRKTWGDGIAWSVPTLTSIPNVDCSVVVSSYRLHITADSTNNPCDLDGGGVASAPITYDTPVPLVTNGELGIEFRTIIDYIDSASPADIHGGVALFDNANSDVVALEYNRDTQLLTLWETNGSGAKVVHYTSPAAIGDVNSQDLRLLVRYYPNTKELSIGYSFSSYSTFAALKTITIGFTPSKYGFYSRIDAGSSAVGTVRFMRAFADTIHSGGASIWERTGALWTESEQLTPVDATGETHKMYAPRAEWAHSASMTPDGVWLIIPGIANRFMQEDGSWYPEFFDIYRDTGSGFSFNQRITPPVSDCRGAALSVDEDGYMTLAICGVDLVGDVYPGARQLFIYEAATAGSALELTQTYDDSSGGFAPHVDISEDGSTIITSDWYADVNPSYAGVVYVIYVTPPYPIRLPAPGLYIDEIRGVKLT